MSANDAQVAEWCRIAKRVVTCGPTWDPADADSASKTPSKKSGPGREN
jgi:hypothetical protein